jgi:hypothetical protein
MPCLSVCSAWLPAADLCSYEENRGKFSLPKKVRGFAEAIWEIEEDPDLVITLGKPPSKRRRRSAQPDRSGQPQDGSCEAVMEQVSSVVAEEGLSTTPPCKPLPPLPSPSSSQPQVAGRPRYMTRRQKRSSEGIVAQITQNFAARMELKSPQLKSSAAADDETHSLQSNQSLEKEEGQDEGGSLTGQVAQNEADTVTHSKRERKSERITRSNSCLSSDSTPSSSEATLPAAKSVEEEATEESVEVGRVEETAFEEAVTAEEKKEEGEGESVVEVGRGKDETEIIEAEAEKRVETDKEKMVEAEAQVEATVEAEEEERGGGEMVGNVETERENGEVKGVGDSVERSSEVVGEPTSQQPLSTNVTCEAIPDNKEKKGYLPRFSVHKDMPGTEVLMVLNYNLKASLSLQALDVPGAMATLRQLQSVQMTAKDLQLVPDVVATLRKVRSFSGDVGVRELAEEVYCSMKTLFESPGYQATPPTRGVRRKMMVTRGGMGGKAPSTRTVGKRSTRSKPAVDTDVQQPYGSDDQTVPTLQSEP